MKLKDIIPWRIRYRLHLWAENFLRPNYTSIYKLLRFGKRNINTPEYWDKVWSNDSVGQNYEGLFDFILEKVPYGAKVLDVGCGIGRLAKLMRDKRDAKVTGLDFSVKACEQLAREGFETIVSKLPKIPQPDNTFDVVIATEVLEHLDHPEKTLKQMVLVLKTGGVIMCSVPNNTLLPHKELEHQQVFDEKRLFNMLSMFSSEVEIKSGRFYKDDDLKFLFGCAVIKK